MARSHYVSQHLREPPTYLVVCLLLSLPFISRSLLLQLESITALNGSLMIQKCTDT